MFRDQRPVEPARFVVLAVGIVVAALGAPRFVPHDNHGYTQRQQRGGEEVLHLPVSQFLDRGIFGRAFEPAVPAPVVVRTVTVVFAIRLVVLRVVRDKIVQSKAVVTGYEVDALLRLACLMSVNLGTAKHPVCIRVTEPSSPRKKLRTSSRNFPFHSCQLSPMKLPT